MKIRLTENNFRNIVCEIVKEVLLESRTETFIERFLHQYLPRFGGTKGQLPQCSREELIQYANTGLRQGCDKAREQGYSNNMTNFIHQLQRNFLPKLQINEKGLIYVERAINFQNNYNFTNMNYKSVGECWSWQVGNAQAYCDSQQGENVNNVILHGYIHPKDVDWVMTLSINTFNNAETELRTSSKAKIELTDITVNNQTIHLNETFLVNAEPVKYQPYQKPSKFKNFFQRKKYSLGDDYSLSTLLNKGQNLVDLCDRKTDIGNNMYLVQYDNHYNIYNKKQKNVLFGDITNIDTWFDGMENEYNIIYLYKNNQQTGLIRTTNGYQPLINHQTKQPILFYDIIQTGNGYQVETNNAHINIDKNGNFR